MVRIVAKKRSGRPHGHYCKICGEYKANEKFSGKGHAAHICKACSRLSAAEKSEAMTINRLMNFPIGRLSANDKKWLENRVRDSRPEVAELAREVYRIHFPYAERNAKKKQLSINHLSFEIHTETFNEYGDELPVNCLFTADRTSRTLTMTNFEADGKEQSSVLDGREMSKLLRWTVHSLEIFMWAEDYALTPAQNGTDPYWDILPEHFDDFDLEDAPAGTDETAETDEFVDPESTLEYSWQVQIEYTDGTFQDITSFQDYLSDRPEELYLSLLEYFEPEEDDFGDDIE